MAKQETPKIFGRKRSNLVKVYALLKAAEERLPRTRIWQTAGISPGTDRPIFLWLYEQGFIDRTEVDESKAYMAYYRRQQRQVKGLFKVTTKGARAIQMYEALFDILGLSEQAHLRFPREAEVVKTKPFSGQKVRV